MSDNAERDAKIAGDYATLSAAKLATKYRVSVPTIRRILSEQGVKKDLELGTEARVIDENHRLLGLRLYFHRNTVRLDSVEKASDSLEWSMKKLRNVEQGFTSITLDDLISMAKYLGISLPTLVEKLT